MLEVSLLGRPQLRLDGRPLAVPRRKSRALVYYLAARRGPVTREHLLSLLWPDLERAAAQQTLRVTLHGLRSVLSEGLLAEGDSLALAPSVAVDARRFAARLSPPPADLEALAAILELYRGDFLDGFGLPDSPAFDDWVAAERERYRRLAVRGLAALAEQHERRGSLADALDVLDRALAFDPLQEDLQRTSMRLHYLAGDRAGAVRRYEGLRRLLDEEMGVPPMAETRALYDAIIGDAVPAFAGRAPTPAPSGRDPGAPAAPSEASAERVPFVGRSAELAALRAFSAEGGRLVVVEGEPGIGKTRLIEEFIREAGATPVVGVAHELEHALPYQPIVEALRGLLARPEWPALRASVRAELLPAWQAEVSRLLPELGEAGASPGDSRRPTEEWRLWEALSQLLTAVARQRPVAVFLDDLHWADAATLGLLGYLVRRAPGAPVLFLAATRPAAPRSPLAALLQTLTREERLARLSLSRLTPDDVSTIARQLCLRHSSRLAAWLVQASEGNPYVLVELLRHLKASGQLSADGALDPAALAGSPVVPQTIYSLILSRLARLSEGARRVLDAAVAVGRVFEFEVVYRAAALSESAALDALDELRAAGLVQAVDGTRYAFDHSLTMEVAYREVGEPRHRLLHRRIAEALAALHRERLESVAGLLAWHFGEGGAPERAAPHAVRAGQQAERLAAWAEAAAFYEQALAGVDAAGREPVLIALGEARLRAGEAGRAADAFHQALDLARSRGDAVAAGRARLAEARALIPQARYSEAIALARQARDEGGPAIAARAEFLWGTALSLEGADLAAAAEHLRAAETLLASADPVDLAGLAQTKFELGGVAAQQGDLRRAVELYRESLAVAEGSADRDAALPHVVLAHNNLAYHLLLLGDPSAEEHALAGLTLARDRGLLGMQPYLLSTLGEIALAHSDLATAEQRFAEGLAIAERLSMPERVAGLTANLGLVAERRGETARAVHRLSTALAQADSLGTRHLAAQIRLWLAPLLPEAEARARLAEARAIAEAGGRRRLLEEVARREADLRLRRC